MARALRRNLVRGVIGRFCSAPALSTGPRAKVCSLLSLKHSIAFWFALLRTLRPPPVRSSRETLAISGSDEAPRVSQRRIRSTQGQTAVGVALQKSTEQGEDGPCKARVQHVNPDCSRVQLAVVVEKLELRRGSKHVRDEAHAAVDGGLGHEYKTGCLP